MLPLSPTRARLFCSVDAQQGEERTMWQALDREGAGRGRSARRPARFALAVTAAGVSALMAGQVLASDEAAVPSGWQTGAQIEAVCSVEPEANAIALTFCLGYLQGALDAYLLGRANCIPGGIDANGLRAALLEHVRRHPERVGKARGPQLVYDAFRATWPSWSRMPALAR
jgi:hypothetical protein